MGALSGMGSTDHATTEGGTLEWLLEQAKHLVGTAISSFTGILQFPCTGLGRGKGDQSALAWVLPGATG